MTTPQRALDARWLVVLLAALTAVLALLLPATPASATPSPAAETRVGASTVATAVVVGVHECITAGQRPVRGPSQLQVALGNCVAAEAGTGGSRVVIGKVDDLKADGAIGPGERTLLDRLPDLGSPRANWSQNSGVLRQEMRRGMPIRDASVDPVTGQMLNNTGFLRAERYLLQDRGWMFDPKATQWLPPGR